MKINAAVEHLRHIAVMGTPRTHLDRQTLIYLQPHEVIEAPVGTVLHDLGHEGRIGVWIRLPHGVVCVHNTWVASSDFQALSDDHLPHGLHVVGAVPGTPAASVMADFAASVAPPQQRTYSPSYRPSAALLGTGPYEDDGEQD